MKKFDFLAKDEPYSIFLPKGQYLFQCWGASGIGYYGGTIGKGGYVSGILSLIKGQTFYVYVGKMGSSGGYKHFNYADDEENHLHGGAATDIRLVKGYNWYDFASLASRIIVAGGGGSKERLNGGNAGGLNGETGVESNGRLAAQGATQTSGGMNRSYYPYGHGTSGRFGIAGNGACHDFTADSCDRGPGGGAGYYGGGGVPFAGSGGGGSSYISGYEGCDSISKESTEDKIVHTGSPIHFSELFFYDPIMKGGNESMISPKGAKMTGNEGDGFARISVISGSLRNPSLCFKKTFSFGYALFILLVRSN